MPPSLVTLAALAATAATAAAAQPTLNSTAACPRLPRTRFADHSVTALRVGDGETPLDGTTAVAFLDEFDLSTGALLQTIPLTTFDHPMTCTIVGGGSYGVGMLTRSRERSLLAIPCYNAPAGTTTQLGTQRNALTIDVNGDRHDQPFNYNSATNVALATIHGDWFWGTTISGIYAVRPTGGVDERAFKVSDSACDTDWFRGLAWGEGGTLYALKKDKGASATDDVQPSVYAVGGAPGAPPPTATPAPEPAVVNGFNDGSAVTQHHSMVFETSDSLWVTDYAGDNTLYHYVRTAGTWAQAEVVPHAEFTVGGVTKKMFNGRGVAGFEDATTGHYTLVYATGNTELGYLMKYDTVAKEFAVFAAGCKGTIYHGVALSPTLLK